MAKTCVVFVAAVATLLARAATLPLANQTTPAAPITAALTSSYDFMKTFPSTGASSSSDYGYGYGSSASPAYRIGVEAAGSSSAAMPTTGTSDISMGTMSIALNDLVQGRSAAAPPATSPVVSEATPPIIKPDDGSTATYVAGTGSTTTTTISSTGPIDISRFLSGQLPDHKKYNCTSETVNTSNTSPGPGSIPTSASSHTRLNNAAACDLPLHQITILSLAVICSILQL